MSNRFKFQEFHPRLRHPSRPAAASDFANHGGHQTQPQGPAGAHALPRGRDGDRGGRLHGGSGVPWGIQTRNSTGNYDFLVTLLYYYFLIICVAGVY